MRAEGIHAHGYHLHALQMAVDLAKEMLQSPPNLGADLINGTLPFHGIVGKGKKKKVNPASHLYTEKASRTLAHCAFLWRKLKNLSKRLGCIPSGLFSLQEHMPRTHLY